VARTFTYLVVDAPDQPQQLILWDTLEITVGRAPDRDIVIAHAEISRQHAVFRMEGQTYTIADLHTSNGTFVNGARVSQHALRPGDVVELGPAQISFRQSADSPKGKHVRFASQLKAFAPLGDADGNRTVLGMTGPGGNAAYDGADYGDRLPSGEPTFDWSSNGGESDDAAPVVDLDPVLDASLEEVELASFEDEELAALEDKPDGPPARAARAAAAAPARPAPAPARAPAPTQVAPAAQPAAPVARAPREPAPPAPRHAAPAAARSAAERPALDQPPVQARAAAAPAAQDEAPARAVLTLEVEGPRGALRAVVGALLDQELEIGPLRLRLRRPS
jgi:hypothetical protein